MDTSKQIFEKQRRVEKSSDVILKFIPFYEVKGYHFNIYNEDEEIKYIGFVARDRKHDECTYHSFMFGNNENYQSEHGVNFNCKHILRARALLGVEL